MNYRDFVANDTLLLLLLCLFMLLLVDANMSVNRVKRLSTPDYEANYTRGLAKFVVSIRSRTPRRFFGDNHYCGGTIIGPRFVLTAAHCVMDKNKFKYPSRTILVVGGTPNRLKFVDTYSVNLPVKEIFIPMNFTSHNTNNIAVLKLKSSWPKNNPRIAIAKLPEAEPVYNESYTVLGWGSMFKGGPMAAHVLHINVTLMEREFCECVLMTFKKEMLCAKNSNDTIDQNPCEGDEGSPLMTNDTVYGVVTYRLGCGNTELPSVYTNVWYHIKWINSIVNAAHRSLLQFVVVMLSLSVLAL